MANKAADGMIKNYSGDLLSKPALIAKTVRKAVTKRRPRTRYLVGFGAELALGLKETVAGRTETFIDAVVVLLRRKADGLDPPALRRPRVRLGPPDIQLMRQGACGAHGFQV